MYQEHHRGTGNDDTSVSTLKFDAGGKLASSAPDLAIKTSNGSTYNINTKVVDIVTDTIDLIGLLLAPETEGVSEAVAKEINEDIKLFVKAFNGIFKAAEFFAEDGGRLNFPAVICHNMNKLCASIGH